jgi:hypothetical protein
MAERYANNSFYQYIMLLAGLTFGIGEFQVLKFADFSDARFVLLVLISIGFAVSLVIKKKRLTEKGEPLYALARPYRHILADYLCVIGITSLFSMFVYVIMNDKDFFEKGWLLSRFSLAIIFNTGCFLAGMLLLWALGVEERRQPR